MFMKTVYFYFCIYALIGICKEVVDQMFAMQTNARFHAPLFDKHLIIQYRYPF